MDNKKKFYSPSGKAFSYEDLLKEVLFYIKSDAKEKYKVIIGQILQTTEQQILLALLLFIVLGMEGGFFGEGLTKKR